MYVCMFVCVYVYVCVFVLYNIYSYGIGWFSVNGKNNLNSCGGNH